MTDRELMQQAYAVPLHEQLASVPESARLVIDDQDGMGTRFIPVGRMCHEAAAALRERLAQPEREWVGLTEEERRSIREWQRIQEELGPVWAPMMLYLYEAIEAKLKEKNT